MTHKFEHFDPTHEYGVLDSAELPVEDFILDAKAFLPPGTLFKILECTRRITYRVIHERAWYYSPTGTVPNPDRVLVLMECVA